MLPTMGAAETLASGDPIGPYRLEERLGEGAVGIVFRAVREPDGELVALKVLRAELSHDEEYRRRFVREARAAGEVHHKHLVPILDAGEADGRSYLAVRFIDGPSLGDVLEREGALEPAAIARIVAHVGSGLDALHAAGMIHRDVKPSNVMVDSTGSARLTDFGLAKGRAYTVLTKPGSIMGTLDYLAPELLRGGEATPATDLYALGCLAYECVAGRAPFGDRSMLELADAHLNDEPPDPTAGRIDASSSVSWAILQALAKDPDDRPPSGTAFGHMVSVAVGPSAAS
jgi:serine/threonine-protein kinase